MCGTVFIFIINIYITSLYHFYLLLLLLINKLDNKSIWVLLTQILTEYITTRTENRKERGLNITRALHVHDY